MTRDHPARRAGRQRKGAIGDDHIDPGIVDDGRQMHRIEIRRAEQDATGEAVEIERREHRGQLGLGSDQDSEAAEIAGMVGAGEATGVIEFA
jgi:hypothetical protein